MAGLRINIMELRQIIRLKKEGISNRKVADMLHLSRNTVNDYVRIFETHKLDYNDLSELDDAALIALFPCKSEINHHRYNILSSYFNHFDSELKKPGCTLETLWKEYLYKHPDGYKHAQFNYHFNIWRSKIQGSFKIEHKAGERVYIDFTEKKLSILDKETGEVVEVNVFVGILPCSQYTFVIAVLTQNREDLIEALGHCLEYFGGEDYTTQRNLDKTVFERLLTLQFIKQRENLIITGPSGIGKSFLAQAIGQSAVKNLFKTSYFNTGKLNEEIKLSKI